MAKHWGAVITAMVTPFDGKGAVNYQAAVELALFLAENGSSAVVLSGTTGESPVLSTGEKLELFRTLSAAAGRDLKIIAGTGSNSTAASVKLTEQAAEAGVDGIMLVTPYYNKPTQEGLYQHFKAIASATNLPVLLYNVPGRTGVNMSAGTTLRLAEIENIVAVKEASADLEQITAICRSAPEGFVVYSGDDSMTLPLLSVGAVGVVSVASHLVGKQIAAMVEHFTHGRVAEAARLHQHLLPIFKGLFMTTSPIPVKAALNMTGINVGLPRLPLVPIEEKLEQQLRELLREYRLLS